jgi:hypothetical protein
MLAMVRPFKEVQRKPLIDGVESLERTVWNARSEGLEWLTVSAWTPEQRHS